MSKFLKAEPLWNVTAAAGKKTLVFHWPGGAWPPTSDNPNLMVVDGTSPGAMGNTTHKIDDEVIVVALAWDGESYWSAKSLLSKGSSQMGLQIALGSLALDSQHFSFS